MDELARRVGVNKAAIYHYFRSKEAILEELIRQFLAGSRDSKTQFIAALLQDDDSALDSTVDALLDYLCANRDLLAVIVLEAVKTASPGAVAGAGAGLTEAGLTGAGAPAATALYRYVQSSLDDALEIIRREDPDHPVLHRHSRHGDRLLAEVFFGLFMPILMYVVLNEGWSSYRSETAGSETAGSETSSSETSGSVRRWFIEQYRRVLRVIVTEMAT